MAKDPNKYPNKYWFKRYIHYNPFTGEFIRTQNGGNGHICTGIKTPKSGLLRINGEWYRMGKIAWIYITGLNPAGNIVHIDGDGDNYKFLNLRDAGSGRGRARARLKNRRWQGYYYVREAGKQIQINAGTFGSSEEAIEAAELKIASSEAG